MDNLNQKNNQGCGINKNVNMITKDLTPIFLVFYQINNWNVTIVEAVNGGTDYVNSTVSYTLGDNLEQLELAETADINATGNSLDNALWGNAGNNILTGGAGNDYLVGASVGAVHATDNAANDSEWRFAA